MVEASEFHLCYEGAVDVLVDSLLGVLTWYVLRLREDGEHSTVEEGVVSA